MELIQFIFRDFQTWIGFVIILMVILFGFAEIAAAFNRKK